MYARIEVAMRPEFPDPAAAGLLRRIELAQPELRRKIRWARLVEVYWLDLPLTREEVIPAINEIFWDQVLQWLVTGNLIPSAAGKHGTVLDVMEAAPTRPGKFWAIERRFRPGVTDNVARTTLEAFEIVLGRKLPNGKAASGALLLLEGTGLNEDLLADISRDVFCNELIETWTILTEQELCKSDRFHQERIKRDLPLVSMKTSDKVESVRLGGLSNAELESLSRRKLWALSVDELKAIRDYFNQSDQKERRMAKGLFDATDVELEILAQTWSEHCKHKIFNARINYRDVSTDTKTEGEGQIPSVINSLFKETIVGATEKISKPWLLSVFEDNAGIVAFDEEDAVCIKVETHNTPSALDPYGGSLTGIVGVNRDILGCGKGAKPIFNTDVFCVAPPDYSGEMPERLLHPRRILDGVRRGVEHGGNKSGIPTVNGALVFDNRYLGKPLIYCGTGGMLPRVVAGKPSQVKEIVPGDRVCMIGGRVGKDGIHGATFSSLPLDELSPASAVQLGDPITQKRVADFLIEARDHGLYRAVTDNGAGGLSSSVGELARLSNGAMIDVSKVRTKYPGLKPYELVVSESQERMTLAVPAEKLSQFIALADRRSVEVSDIGEFTDKGTFDVYVGDKPVASLELEFLHKGLPTLEIQALWNGRVLNAQPVETLFEKEGGKVLLELLARPNIASKEWLIRQYDHEVQGTSVIKPLHTAFPATSAAFSGPNDASVIKPKTSSTSGIAIGCGINPKLSDIDPYLMAQSAVDEAVRNVLCVGADFGRQESFLAIVDNFCWPDPQTDTSKAAALVRACFGLKEAAINLDAPLISGKDSMKNDYKGKQKDRDIIISVPPTLLITAMAKLKDVYLSRSADFKARGDVIYLIGSGNFGLLGSELHSAKPQALPVSKVGNMRVGLPNWNLARTVYSWIGGGIGKEQAKLRSLHDVSEGGLLVSVAESCLARGLGALIQLPDKLADQTDVDPWEFCFGEGFHAFIGSVADMDSASVENEWAGLGVPFVRLGAVTTADKLQVKWNQKDPRSWSVDIRSIRSVWRKEGYWE